ncbi:hypothetical protein OAF27_02710, partial [Verrucomicrobiales bacterium]|nr:hypothetical protein [Verrucomicrobiales bacterium]
MVISRLVFAFLITFVITASGAENSEYEPQVGDIFFQSLPKNDVVDAIERATGSPYSHCGILV